VTVPDGPDEPTRARGVRRPAPGYEWLETRSLGRRSHHAGSAGSTPSHPPGDTGVGAALALCTLAPSLPVSPMSVTPTPIDPDAVHAHAARRRTTSFVNQPLVALALTVLFLVCYPSACW
jgi:hypothetical protein